MLSFAIIGGGPTGVELAAEAAELIFETFHEYYRNAIHFDEVSLTLVNSGDALLRPFSPRFQKYAEKVLENKKVTILNNTRVSEITKNSIITSKGEELSAATIIWTAGVKAHNVKCSHDLMEVNGCLLVDETMQVSGHKNIFALGDISYFPTDDGRRLPMLAQVAKQQGIMTGKNITRLIEGKPLKEFKYHSRGNLASLGQWHAIADLHFVSFTGHIAWFVWRTIYLHNFASWRKRLKITLDWTINIFSERDITHS